MTIHLRQVCLVARELRPAVADLEAVLGLSVCFQDPAVAQWGLENSLLPLGHNFLEVVAPTRDGTAAGRFLDRRDGDGGYMVICQTDDEEVRLDVRDRAAAQGVRVAYEHNGNQYHLMQLHPADMGAAFLEVDYDAQEDFDGHWEPAGGYDWKAQVCTDRVSHFAALELQADDPGRLAERWSLVTGRPLSHHPSGPGPECWLLPLSNADLRFVRATDGRGDGLGGIDLIVEDRDALLAAARARGAFVSDDQVQLCGTRFYLREH